MLRIRPPGRVCYVLRGAGVEPAPIHGFEKFERVCMNIPKFPDFPGVVRQSLADKDVHSIQRGNNPIKDYCDPGIFTHRVRFKRNDTEWTTACLL